MVTMFPVLINSFTLSGTFYLFSSVAMLAVLFGMFILPETKGKTLSDINRMFYTRPIIKCDVCSRYSIEKDTKYSDCLQAEVSNNENIIKKRFSALDEDEIIISKKSLVQTDVEIRWRRSTKYTRFKCQFSFEMWIHILISATAHSLEYKVDISYCYRNCKCRSSLVKYLFNMHRLHQTIMSVAHCGGSQSS